MLRRAPWARSATGSAILRGHPAEGILIELVEPYFNSELRVDGCEIVAVINTALQHLALPHIFERSG